MEIVGHSGIEMTMNVYGHINLETQRRALNDLDQALSQHPVDVKPRCQRGLKIVYNAPTWCAIRDSNPEPAE